MAFPDMIYHSTIPPGGADYYLPTGDTPAEGYRYPALLRSVIFPNGRRQSIVADCNILLTHRSFCICSDRDSLRLGITVKTEDARR